MVSKKPTKKKQSKIELKPQPMEIEIDLNVGRVVWSKKKICRI